MFFDSKVSYLKISVPCSLPALLCDAWKYIQYILTIGSIAVYRNVLAITRSLYIHYWYGVTLSTAELNNVP